MLRAPVMLNLKKDQEEYKTKVDDGAVVTSTATSHAGPRYGELPKKLKGHLHFSCC